MEVNFNKSKNNDTKNQTLWWDPACEEAKSLKYKALRKFRATNFPEDFATYKSQRNRFKSLCKLKKNDFQRKRRSALLDSKDNPKLFWQTIKGNSVSKTEKDNVIKCEDWLDYFEDLFSSPDTDLNGNAEDIFRNNINENNADNLDLPITEEEIRASIRNLNLNRSGGPDGLCIEMFKVTIDIIMPYLHDLFNYLYEHGIFPEDWCKSIISPIHKGGPVNKPENYRAVMLINCLCKIFMNILTIFFFFFFFFFFFGFGFYGPFKNISLISSRSFIEGGRKPENPEKNHLTIRKQNLAFPHMTRARLEPQR